MPSEGMVVGMGPSALAPARASLLAEVSGPGIPVGGHQHAGRLLRPSARARGVLEALAAGLTIAAGGPDA